MVVKDGREMLSLRARDRENERQRKGYRGMRCRVNENRVESFNQNDVSLSPTVRSASSLDLFCWNAACLQEARFGHL